MSKPLGIYNHAGLHFALKKLSWLGLVYVVFAITSICYSNTFHVTLARNELIASYFQARNTIPSSKYGLLPKPFINIGMPKMGTSSLHQFFRCGNYTSSHWECGYKTHHICAYCMKDAIANALPPLKTCGNYDVFAQMDSGVFYPQIELLDEIHTESPNATFILSFRNTTDWYRSLSNWYMGGAKQNLNQVIERTNITGLPPGKGKNETEFTEWFGSHVRNIRNFVAKYPSHSLVEFNMADPNAGKQLGSIFGVPESCWGHANKNPKLHNGEATK